jgi:hypothetical protein
MPHSRRVRTQKGYLSGPHLREFNSLHQEWLIIRPAFQNSILMRRRPGIVFTSPDDIPSSGDKDESDEDDGGVVHGDGGDGEVGGHAEEGDG